MPVLAINKKASFSYDLLDKYEAGLVLLGSEVKSIKSGQISIKEAYVVNRNNAFYLIKANIPLYKKASTISKQNYDPQRPIKLLLNAREIQHLRGKLEQKGLTLVPLRLYTKGTKHRIKLEFALASGKKKADKREAIKKRDVKRQIQHDLKTKIQN